MNLEKLLEEGKIRKVTKKEFDLSLANRDLSTAKHNLESGDYDWALSIAYNAVLQASRALMFFLGYRPIGKYLHKHVFEFLLSLNIDSDMVDYFDKVRKTRHTAVYDVADSVSEENASEAITLADSFVQKIRTYVQKIRTIDKDD